MDVTLFVPPLRPPEHRVDPRARLWWTLNAALEVLGLLVVEIAVLVWYRPGWLVAVLVATVILGACYALVMPRWRYRVHRWEVDQQAVYTLSGWLWLQWRVAPVSRIQTIDTARSPLQRLFGVASVTVTTASSAGPVRIEGLDAAEAAQLARRLTEVTQRDHGDAT